MGKYKAKIHFCKGGPYKIKKKVQKTQNLPHFDFQKLETMLFTTLYKIKWSCQYQVENYLILLVVLHVKFTHFEGILINI